MMKKAVVLVSGGIDSSTCCAIAANEGFSIYAMSFMYGQRHSIELESARRIAQAFGAVDHRIVNIDLRAFGGSSLTSDLEVPKDRSTDNEYAIPSTYVPARNTIFLSFATGWAEIIDCFDIFIGVNAVDYSGYPDCRPEYIAAYQTMANLATKNGVEGKKLTIHTPLISLSKSDIIKLGTKLGVDYSITHSCYDPDSDGNACGRCDSCTIRRKGFEAAGVTDPTRYTKRK
jgi:7-cyano-7-deazaguanine synthase